MPNRTILQTPDRTVWVFDGLKSLYSRFNRHEIGIGRGTLEAKCANGETVVKTSLGFTIWRVPVKPHKKKLAITDSVLLAWEGGAPKLYENFAAAAAADEQGDLVKHWVFRPTTAEFDHVTNEVFKHDGYNHPK